MIGAEPATTDTESDSSRGSGARGGTGLHAEQHYDYHRPIRAGDVLTLSTRPGKSWEKQGRRGGLLQFRESITEYRDGDGELVLTARSVGVLTAQAVTES